MMGRASPIFRLSLGLASLTICLLLSAEMLGFMPDRTQVALDARQKICEALAMQLSWSAIRNNRRSIEQTLTSVVESNPDLLSASLKSRQNGTIFEVGNHAALWDPPEDGSSTPTNVQVPIFSDRGQWGALQLSFEPISSVGRLSTWMQSTFGLILFVSIAGFLAFSLFLKRAMNELDPSRVIPDHVKAAFDALAEGVLIMDEQEHIVLANKSFARLIGCDPEELTGIKAAKLGWSLPKSGEDEQPELAIAFPWQFALDSCEIKTGVPLLLSTSSGDVRTLIASGSPIVDADGNPRGALATFDDVSELQKNNADLQRTMKRLAQSKDEIKRQNSELRFLATRDPLTRCLNRRALFERFEDVFHEARVESHPLYCAMIDIDHFKSFNDRYGHVAGDKVIKFVAKELHSATRSHDIVARYGGEEFFIVMPGLDRDAAVDAAERLRINIKENFNEKFTSSRDLTISVGLSSLQDHTDTMNAMLNRADEALYAAKHSGRDCVIEWSNEIKAISDHTLEHEGSEVVDADASMLIELGSDPEETLKVMGLSNRVKELDTLIEEKSGKFHRKHGFDALTGLPNRILFYDRVTQSLGTAQREGNSVAILYLDIVLQQRVGEAMEPVMGDLLLKEVSERLSSLLRDSEELLPLLKQTEELTVSRLGNTEFGIVLPDLVSTESVTWIVQSLFDCLNKPIQAEGKEVYASCSIGISLYPTDGETVETLVGCASQARHLAHANQGRHKYLFYSEDMNVRSYQQVRLESQLRDALKNNEFALYYQPIYKLQTGKIDSFEVLLRWDNPEMGMVGPAMFIQIAEQTGQIAEIGEWVLRNACEQAKQWIDEGAEDLQIAVNLSPVQLRTHGFQKTILEVLKETGLPPSHLELEITETALMDNVVQANDVLQELRAKGVSIAMDDFGTGFSSLSHLKHLVVDKLKIDRSFVRDVVNDKRDAAVVSSIIAMAKLMGMKVVAEGVEKQEQLDFLKKRRCDLVQGFLLSRPIPAEKASAMLKSQNDYTNTMKAHSRRQDETDEAKPESSELESAID